RGGLPAAHPGDGLERLPRGLATDAVDELVAAAAGWLDGARDADGGLERGATARGGPAGGGGGAGGGRRRRWASARGGGARGAGGGSGGCGGVGGGGGGGGGGGLRPWRRAGAVESDRAGLREAVRARLVAGGARRGDERHLRRGGLVDAERDAGPLLEPREPG